LKDGTVSHKVPFDELLYAQAYGNFVKVITAQQTIVTAMTMRQMEEALPERDFARIHKSFIVNIAKVTKVDGNLAFIGDLHFPIGAVYKLAFSQKL
jgi:DNA-binding LytR/AlgR family response regulator